jgi:hypothetical protein
MIISEVESPTSLLIMIPLHATTANSSPKEQVWARGAAAAVAAPLPAKRAAAKCEISLVRATRTTSVAQVCRVE